MIKSIYALIACDQCGQEYQKHMLSDENHLLRSLARLGWDVGCCDTFGMYTVCPDCAKAKEDNEKR